MDPKPANDTHHPATPVPPRPDGPTRPPRRALTYAILAGAGLTVLAVAGMQRRNEARAAAWRPAPATLPAPRSPEPREPIVEVAAPAPRPRVELVFALDTTSSMSGLIEGAKRKIWSLASFVAQGQPSPDLRVGLVAYRDIGDRYVTKVFDLDADLDRVYRRLRGFTADGGGDTREHVARALDESVRRMSWSQPPEVVKVIYLVGDAAPHTDYDDGYDFGRAARLAKRKGIQLHTIQCGEDGEAQAAWRKIASLGGGQYMAIPQDGGMLAERSRYDDELAELHDKLARTTIAYGAAKPIAEAAVREAEAAPASVKAARAAYLARKGKAVAGGGDLVDSVARGEVKLAEIQSELPAEMKPMTPAAQAALLAKKHEERQAINRRIAELGQLRQKELDAREAAAAQAGSVEGFDLAAKKALRKSVADNKLSGLAL